MRGSGTILVITILLGLLAAVGWFAWAGLAGPGEPMPSEDYVVLALGALIAVLVGIGLMALVFYSGRRWLRRAAALSRRPGMPVIIVPNTRSVARRRMAARTLPPCRMVTGSLQFDA
jgi:hypothetical protein